MVYAHNYTRVKTSSLERSEADNRRYGNPDPDPGGLWREGNLSTRTWSGSSDYAIQSPFTGELHYPAGKGPWRHLKLNIKKWVERWESFYCEKDISDGKVKALILKEGFSPEVAKRATKMLNEPEWPFIWFGLAGIQTLALLKKCMK